MQKNEFAKAFNDESWRVYPHSYAFQLSNKEWIPYAYLTYISKKIAENISRGNGRILVNLPPRHGKSHLISKWTPIWFLDLFPDRRILLATYEAGFAAEWGYLVRNEMRDNPLCRHKVKEDSQAKADWLTVSGGGMKTAGFGGPLTGRGGDLIIVDDPIKNWQEASSTTMRRHIIDWFNSTLYTRLEPGGTLIVLMCMTGDTPITMGDGTIKLLQNIKIGDEVRTWENGQFITKKVLQFAQQGIDQIYEIRAGGSRVKANARHPFLVRTSSGNFKWVKTEDLDKLNQNDCLVISNRDYELGNDKISTLTENEAWLLGYMFGDGWITIRDTQQKGKQTYTTKDGEKHTCFGVYPRRGYVTCVALSMNEEENNHVADCFKEIFGIIPKITKYGYRRTDIARVGRWFIDKGLKGKAKTKQLPPFIFSEPVRIREIFLQGLFSADGYKKKNNPSKGQVTVLLANKLLIQSLRHLCRSVGWPVSDVHYQKRKYNPPNSPTPIIAENWSFQANVQSAIKDAFIFRRIKSLKKVEDEMVYDLQIEGTENFIADGLVTHNTRWHEEDLAGYLLKEHTEKWTHINFPAICEKKVDEIGRTPGQALCPDRFDMEALFKIKNAVGSQVWAGLYQQRPAALEGGLIKRSWLRFYTKPPESYQEMIQSWDMTFKLTTDGSYVVGQVWGRQGGNFYLVHQYRMRTDFPGMRQAVKTVSYLYPEARRKIVEEKANGAAIIADLQKELPGLIPFHSSDSKESRLSAVSPYFESGNVYLPDPSIAPWIREYIEELCQFPNAANDDQVDATSQAILSFRSQKFEIPVVGQGIGYQQNQEVF